MELEALLKIALRGGASEILLKSGLAPRFRFNNELVPFSDNIPITPELLQSWLEKILPGHITKRLETQGDAHFSYASRLGVRFRVLVFRQRQSFSILLRAIPTKIPTPAEFSMPASVTALAEQQNGLVVFAGRARSGKSTLMASLLSSINASRSCHILTIEDPIEFNLPDQRSLIEQREVGIDTPSFEKGLRSALHHRPDILAISELRDKESLELCLHAAQGGTLVLLPMAAMGVADALDRLLHQWNSVLSGTTSHYLASCLRAVVALTPVKRADGNGFIAATEVLMNSKRLQGWLLGKAEGESGWGFVKNMLAERGDTPHRSLDKSLLELLQDGRITLESAMESCENQDDFQKLLRRAG